MRSSHRIGADTVVVTRKGVVLADALHAGDQVLVARRGALEYADVLEVNGEGPTECQRLFTPLGDALLPSDASIVSRHGLGAVSDLAAEVGAGKAVRLEVVPPTSWKISAQPHGAFWAQVAEVAAGRPIPLPAWCDDNLVESVTQLLRELGVAADEWRGDRWTVIVPGKRRRLSRAPAQSPARAMQLLTAWDDRGKVTTRTLVTDARLRALLIAALSTEKLPFEAHWLPGYFPVECRIELIADGFPTFVPLKAARPEDGEVVQLTVSAEKASLISTFLVVAPANSP